MNIRGMANSAIQPVNPNIPVTIKTSNGYTIDPLTREQVPSWLSYNAMGQLQALDGDELSQLNFMNIGGVLRGLYIYGSVSGVIRPESASTAHIFLTSNENGVAAERQWNVYKVLETWAGWCKVAIVLVHDDN